MRFYEKKGHNLYLSEMVQEHADQARRSVFAEIMGLRKEYPSATLEGLLYRYFREKKTIDFGIRRYELGLFDRETYMHNVEKAVDNVLNAMYSLNRAKWNRAVFINCNNGFYFNIWTPTEHLVTRKFQSVVRKGFNEKNQKIEKRMAASKETIKKFEEYGEEYLMKEEAIGMPGDRRKRRRGGR